MKKFITLVMLFIISFIIVGCDSSESDFTLSKEMIINNIATQTNINSLQRNNVLVSEIDY